MGYFNEDQAYARQIILDHYESPDNKIDEKKAKEIYSSYLQHTNNSVSCIDNLTLYLLIENEIIKDAKFFGVGCAVSTASTDIFCNLIKNLSIYETKLLLDNYFKMIDKQEYSADLLKDLIIFKNVNQQMSRIKCAKVGISAIATIIEKR
ncbi:MAG: iron-sulfur cluster assembly scaffold protein [Malacoplasma sp.]|nr:iron-sulfur cluster assembly scaffold protein [Malacoplasma sp.]